MTNKKKSKVLLIRPANVYGYNNYPSLGLLSIAAALRNALYDTQIINCAFERNPRYVIYLGLKELLFVGVTMMTSECPDAYKQLHLIRAVSKAPIVVGGWHATLYARQILDSGLADYVVRGDGEKQIVQIAHEISAGAKGRTIPLPPGRMNMRKVPPVNYLLDEDIQHFITSQLTDTFCKTLKKPLRWLPYESSRGCPSRCTFCANVVTGNRRYRARPYDEVAVQMDKMAEDFGLNHIKIVDDNFFVDIERVRKIAKQLCILPSEDNTCPKFTWDAECRCDYFNKDMLNDETLDLCKRSGLVQLTLGIESGDQGSLDLMKKGITPLQAEHAVYKCDLHGIFARCSFIVGLPGESRQAIAKTSAFINKLRRKYKYFSCGVQTFRPYPKCELTAELIKSGKWSEPNSFKDWTRRETVNMFTAATLKRPWQADPDYTEAVASYQSVESAIGLPLHMLSRKSDMIKLRVFQKLAHLRNRTGFYRIPYDKVLYNRFERRFYNG